MYYNWKGASLREYGIESHSTTCKITCMDTFLFIILNTVMYVMFTLEMFQVLLGIFINTRVLRYRPTLKLHAGVRYLNCFENLNT